MPKTSMPVVKRPLSSWIFAENTKFQLLLLAVIVITVFARVLPLEMQKRIINQAINLRKLDLLFIYCGIFFAAVVAANALKFTINILQTLISQRATASMRKALYEYILTLPLSFFRDTQPGMAVNALVNELSLPGNYVGMAVAVPVTNILTLLTFAGYLVYLNLSLAAVSISIYPIVLLLIPLLQRKANQYNKERVDLSRDLSSRIAESISGIHEVQGNGAFSIENRKFESLVDRLERVRIRWSIYRFAVKVANNFFTGIGPFLVFILGGYLAIKGRLEIGALVAFLSAQEKLYDPWRELIEFYQVYQDGRVAYQRTMTYFDVPVVHQIHPADRMPYALDNSVDIENLSMVTDDGIRLLDDVSLALKPGEHMALVGFSGSGKSTLALCIGQLYKYTSGSIRIGGQEVADLTKQDIVNNIGFVSQAPFIFDGTIEENLLYAQRAQRMDQNPDGQGADPSLDDMIAVLQQTGIFADVLRFGLNTIIQPGENPELVEAIVRARDKFQRQFGHDLSEWVEFFNEEKYLFHSSIADNLIFGTPNDPAFTSDHLIENTFLRSFLREVDLDRPLLTLGAELTIQTVNLLKNLPPDEIFFAQSPITSDELGPYQSLIEQLRYKKLHQLGDDTKDQLMILSLRFTPGLHKMVALPTLLERLILEGRDQLKDRIAEEMPNAVSTYRVDQYSHSQTILNNILFGKTQSQAPHVQERISQSIVQLLIEEDILEAIVQIGMKYQVGSNGDKLSGGQRQKLAIARAFLKASQIMIMDEATSALDNKSQSRVQNIIDNRFKGQKTLIAVVHRLDIIKNFDKIGVMKAGKMVEVGTYQELMERKGILYELQYGRK